MIITRLSGITTQVKVRADHFWPRLGPVIGGTPQEFTNAVAQDLENAVNAGTWDSRIVNQYYETTIQYNGYSIIYRCAKLGDGTFNIGTAFLAQG